LVLHEHGDDLVARMHEEAVPGVEALVGLDVLLEIKLLLDGPAKSFTLEF
jgi:hypothetical protein